MTTWGAGDRVVAVENLIAYIDRHVEELVLDLVPALREVDPLFRECDPVRLHPTLSEALRHFSGYADRRDPRALEAAFETLRTLWPTDRLYQSALIRIFFGVEDLVAIRAQALYDDLEEFIDALRALRAAVREALCSFGDRVQRRHARPEDDELDDRHTMPLSGGSEATPLHDIEARLPAARSANVERMGQPPPVGRADEHRHLWTRLRAVAARDGGEHQVVGVKAPSGYGKTTLVQSFLERVHRQLGRAPEVLHARAPRLFDLPAWPIAVLLRDALGVRPGMEGNADRVRSRLHALAEVRRVRAPEAAEALLQSEPFVLRLLGEEPPGATLGGLSPRTVGLRTRAALVGVVEALAVRARGRTGAPLFLFIDDANDMDESSWELLRHVIRRVDTRAPLMVLLTYDARFGVPPSIARLPGFGEITLPQFDLGEGEAVIDGLLAPNRLDDQTRLRLNAGARGSPLLLYEAVRQLVEDGVLGLEGGHWVEVMPLPEGVVGDLPAIVARRRQRMGEVAAKVLEIVVITEDTTGGTVLEEVAGRRAIGRDELLAALDELARHGLVEVDDDDERGLTARTRHPLVRDEVYRQMGLDRRRAIHEDAGEVLARLAGPRAFASLAASHLALAGLPGRALHALVQGIDRCLGADNLSGTLDLCGQALGLLDGLPAEDHDRFLYEVLRRRERVHGRMGRHELQDEDLAHLEQLARVMGDEDQRRALARRRASLAVVLGRHAEAEERALASLPTDQPGSEAWVRTRLLLALNCWQRGDRDEARIFIEEAFEGAQEVLPPSLRARLLHARGLIEAGGGHLPEATHHLFEAWRLLRRGEDMHTEALVVQALGELFHARGRLLDAQRLLRRADALLRDADEPRARARVLVDLGDLYAMVGDFDEADRCYLEAQRRVDRTRDRGVHAAAVIGQGRILVHRGQFEEAMSVLAQCIKELGRNAVREPIYVDALVALAMNFAMFARGEKLVLGGLRYAGDAADHATRIGHFRGLVQALVIQVRGLVVLDRAAEASARLADLDVALDSALAADPRMARLRTEVELCRYQVCKALGHDDEADVALRAAWAELQNQLGCLRGSGYERGFLTNISQHREIVMAVGEQDEL